MEQAEVLGLTLAGGRVTGVRTSRGDVEANTLVWTAGVHLSLNAPNTLIQEVVRAFFTGWYGELVTALPKVENGFVRPPDGPGLGLELRPEVRQRGDAHVRSSTMAGVRVSP